MDPYILRITTMKQNLGLTCQRTQSSSMQAVCPTTSTHTALQPLSAKALHAAMLLLHAQQHFQSQWLPSPAAATTTTILQ